MKRLVRTLMAVILLAVVFVACCKEGLNGKATLEIRCTHHGELIKNHIGWPDTVFIKYNSNTLPGEETSDFDTYVVGVEGEDKIVVENIKCGNYFLFAVGLDSTGPYRVKGGIPIKLKYSERKDVLPVEIPLTED